MITQPTVLVLGAGASVPYGFPSGQKLMLDILHELDPNTRHGLISTLYKYGIKEHEIKEFHMRLSRSGKSSVDAFLAYRTEFMRLGKLAITLNLSNYEKEDKLFDPSNMGKSWYEYLWNRLDAPFDDFNKNKLSIITFNYDRSIEHYLITAMINLYKESEKACAEKLNTIPIIHVYGRIGFLPWQERQEELVRSYISGINLDQVENVIELIKIIPEQKMTSPEFGETKAIMSKAKRIYFLGFGYDQINLQRLGKKQFEQKHPMGTTLGKGNAEREEILGGWGIKVKDTHNEVLEFLKNHAILN